MDLHTDTNNLAPNEYREVVNPSGLVVHKGLKAMIVVIDSFMDRSLMMFTSDVSLPKDDKTAM